MPQGSVNYYKRVIHEMDGLKKVQKFYRLFLIPGMTHGIGMERRIQMQIRRCRASRGEMA